MEEQSYAAHRRWVPLYHFVLSTLLLVTLIGACINVYKSLGDEQRIYSASLILVLVVAAILIFFFTRTFALKAQDRAIRAEESLRHYLLTGSPLDPRLSTRQVIGLRFAADEEFPELAKRAVDEDLSEEKIKQAVKTWKADHYRV
jgi:hypothetical protein